LLARRSGSESALEVNEAKVAGWFQEPKTGVDANALFTKAREFMSKWGNLPALSDKFQPGTDGNAV
jgi:hypothetical protein